MKVDWLPNYASGTWQKNVFDLCNEIHGSSNRSIDNPVRMDNRVSTRKQSGKSIKPDVSDQSNFSGTFHDRSDAGGRV